MEFSNAQKKSSRRRVRSFASLVASFFCQCSASSADGFRPSADWYSAATISASVTLAAICWCSRAFVSAILAFNHGPLILCNASGSEPAPALLTHDDVITPQDIQGVRGFGVADAADPLATVMERTPEIGIRRAIGATQKDIMRQFLIEAAALSFLGGILGVLLGWATTYLITLYAGWKTIVSFYAVFLAFSVSAAVGIIFGFYPARQAALTDPIKSLRYE